MLVTCPECKRWVSDQAESCPHCGLPFRSREPQRVVTGEDSFWTRSRGLGDLVLFVIFLTALLLAALVVASC